MNVDLLITIAAADNMSNQVDRSVPDNAKENLNIYQTTPSLIKSHGGKNSTDNPKKTKVINSNYTNRYIGEPGKSDYQEIDYSSIDEITQPVVNDKILNTVQDGPQVDYL